MSFKFENSDYEVEMDNKKFFTTPRKLFIVFYLFILVGIIIVGIKKIDYMHYSKNQEIPSLIESYERPTDLDESINAAIVGSNESAQELNDKVTEYVETIKTENSDLANQFVSLTSNLELSVKALNSNEYWATDIDIFKSILKTNINDAGFNASVNYLNDEQWTNLHNYLISIFS